MSTAAEELARDLYTYLVNEFYSVPWARRQRSCWVMNQEWFDECRKISGWPEPGVTTMFGLPIEVRAAAGGGFPHLIADWPD